MLGTITRRLVLMSIGLMPSFMWNRLVRRERVRSIARRSVIS